MPQYPNRQFLAFEKPIKELYEQIDDTKKLAEKNPKIDYSATIAQLEAAIAEKRKEITQHLTPWQRVQLSRHPDRPYTLKYIQNMCTNFLELHGDRNVKDDKAMVGGFAELDGETVMIIGQQKGRTIKEKIYRNFGMPHPEGYRKALRLMKLAEQFDLPVITLIDTPGAYPGANAEARGQSAAIACNLREMVTLKVPIICAAKIPAFFAAFRATVAAGTPLGICKIDKTESHPSIELEDFMGTPITGKVVILATIPGK